MQDYYVSDAFITTLTNLCIFVTGWRKFPPGTQTTIAYAFSKEGSHLIKITTSKTYETEKRVYIRVNY